MVQEHQHNPVFTAASHENQSQGETKACAYGKYDIFNKVIVVRYTDNRYGQYDTVRSDQHEVNPPHVVQRRRLFLDNDFQQLYKAGNQDNEGNRTEKFQMKRNEN